MFVFLTRGSRLEVQTSVQPVPQGLPHAPDYHAVLVDEDNPLRVLVGTHDGVYESSDGGQTWQRTTLAGVDAMSLDSAADSTVWASGHGVLSLSVDGGETWRSVVPRGLPELDIHAFAVDPADSRNLYAAIANRGLYRSRDGGASFVRVSEDVGGKVVSLALTGSGGLIASDTERGLVLTLDGGRSWQPLMSTPLEVSRSTQRTRERSSVVVLGCCSPGTADGRSWRSSTFPRARVRSHGHRATQTWLTLWPGRRPLPHGRPGSDLDAHRERTLLDLSGLGSRRGRLDSKPCGLEPTT